MAGVVPLRDGGNRNLCVGSPQAVGVKLDGPALGGPRVSCANVRSCVLGKASPPCGPEQRYTLYRGPAGWQVTLQINVAK